MADGFYFGAGRNDFHYPQGVVETRVGFISEY